VSPLDVEEVREELDAFDSMADTSIVMGPNHIVSRSEYIAYKFSNSKCFDVDLKSLEGGSSIEVILRRPLDWDIITFAPKHFWNKQFWCAILGAIDMYNPGGAVLMVHLTVNARNLKLVEIELMGGVGKYLLAFSKCLLLDCIQIVKAMNIDGHDEIIDTEAIEITYNVDEDVTCNILEIIVHSLQDGRKNTHSIVADIQFRY